MSSNNSSFHIPFPRTFLAVNTPVKKAANLNHELVSPTTEPPASSFLSNRAGGHASRTSVSSMDSTTSAGTLSPPSSPPTKAADSPVLGPKIFAPLAVNTKHALPTQAATAVSPIEKSSFLSNRF